jgi:hypothetical protein
MASVVGAPLPLALFLRSLAVARAHFFGPLDEPHAAVLERTRPDIFDVLVVELDEAEVPA